MCTFGSLQLQFSSFSEYSLLSDIERARVPGSTATVIFGISRLVLVPPETTSFS